jgi:tRNA G26 N,N-dimethylase Trm1
MKREATARRLKQEKRVGKLISLVHAEAEAPATYYVVDKICDKMDLPIPPLRKVLEKLRRGGFQTAFTHFRSTGIKTDAPAYVVKEIIRNLVT